MEIQKIGEIKASKLEIPQVLKRLNFVFINKDIQIRREGFLQSKMLYSISFETEVSPTEAVSLIRKNHMQPSGAEDLVDLIDQYPDSLEEISEIYVIKDTIQVNYQGPVATHLRLRVREKGLELGLPWYQQKFRVFTKFLCFSNSNEE